MSDRKPVYLVGCGKRKRAEVSTAAALYTGDLFRKSFDYAIAQVDGPVLSLSHVLILSAKHGVLGMLDHIEPYDVTLSDMTAAERRAWGAGVTHRLAEVFGTPVEGGGVWPPMGRRHFVILAGRLYRDPITPMIEASGSTWEAPMAGLSIGQQLAWLKARLEEAKK